MVSWFSGKQSYPTLNLAEVEIWQLALLVVKPFGFEIYKQSWQIRDSMKP
jgi:hypothetical protein